jgi:hypothetical protein
MPASMSRRMAAYFSRIPFDFPGAVVAVVPLAARDWRQFGEGPQDPVGLAAGEGGQKAGADGAEAAPGGGEVSAQVGKAQVVGGGQPPQV